MDIENIKAMPETYIKGAKYLLQVSVASVSDDGSAELSVHWAKGMPPDLVKAVLETIQATAALYTGEFNG